MYLISHSIIYIDTKIIDHLFLFHQVHTDLSDKDQEGNLFWIFPDTLGQAMMIRKNVDPASLLLPSV